MKLNPNLIDFWFDGEPCAENFRKARNRVLYGGRSSSKSWEFAGMAAVIGSNYKTRFLCVRRFQNKIKESVYTLISDQISRFKIGGFNVMATEIKHSNGSEYAFYGIERNTEEIKSFEGADILWIEEAHSLTEAQWDILEPTIRKEGSEVWISFNPKLASDFVYKRFVVNPPENSIVRLINYTENPFLSETMLKIINQRKESDPDGHSHIYLGVPKDSDVRAIIKRSWIMAAIDAHLKIDPETGIWTGKKTIGYDVADDGDDNNAITISNGSIIHHIEEWSGGEDQLTESTIRVRDAAIEHGCHYIGYDSIGVGAGTGSTLNNNNWKNHFKFNAAAKVFRPKDEYKDGVKNEEAFSNLKAQAWRVASNRFLNTYNAIHKGMKFDASEIISLDSSTIDSRILERLIDELSEPLRDTDANGKEKVESKKDLAKRGVKSPNLADSLIISISKRLTEEDNKPAGLLIPSRLR